MSGCGCVHIVHGTVSIRFGNLMASSRVDAAQSRASGMIDDAAVAFSPVLVFLGAGLG